MFEVTLSNLEKQRFLKLINKWLLVFCIMLGIINHINAAEKYGFKKNDTITRIAVQKPLVIEVVGKLGTTLNAQKLLSICQRNNIPATAVYQWQNHLVIYGKIKNTEALRKQIALSYTNCKVKLYTDLFYEFNRSHCSNKQVAKEWDNVILTADLVANKTLQKEYLNYHATQFEKWPEVAQGFCNADFQQLLVFKNERQLMLIISIPKGKSLDELNPKTSENNPRVDEWNALMKKYQQGIPGTKPGEVWVFLKPVEKL